MNKLTMQLDEINNKEKIAIVVVGYNRIKSIRRLLTSLSNAHYSQEVPLIISIDCSGDTELYEYVRNFEWKHGTKYVNIQEHRLGLKEHIFQCGDLTKSYRAVIVLEDDIFVSEFFYDYIQKAVDYYYDDDRIGGISLYQNEMGGIFPVTFMNDGSDTYLKQSPASWGECWTDKQWERFRIWYSNFKDEMFEDIDMQDYIKKWKKAWSKYYKAYLVSTGRYIVFPQISFTTCFGEVGEHSSTSTNVGQVNLIVGEPKCYFKPFEEMIRYDTYGTNECVYQWVGLSKSELCVDFRCEKTISGKYRYILSPAVLSLPVIKSYGLMMRPIELNVKYDIDGAGLFLYDTKGSNNLQIDNKYPFSISDYFLRGYSPRYAMKYAFGFVLNTLRKRSGIKRLLRF